MPPAATLPGRGGRGAPAAATWCEAARPRWDAMRAPAAGGAVSRRAPSRTTWPTSRAAVAANQRGAAALRGAGRASTARRRCWRYMAALGAARGATQARERSARLRRRPLRRPTSELDDGTPLRGRDRRSRRRGARIDFAGTGGGPPGQPQRHPGDRAQRRALRAAPAGRRAAAAQRGAAARRSRSAIPPGLLNPRFRRRPGARAGGGRRQRRDQPAARRHAAQGARASPPAARAR